MDNTPHNETSARIMDIAEELFMTRGYKAVRLRDIAEAVGMRHASLYYYAPKGKEQLFIEVVRRSMQRHEREMGRLIEAANQDIRQQAYAVSDWLVSQPPLDLVRMFEADMPEIAPAIADELIDLMLDGLTRPLAAALKRAYAAGEVAVADSEMAAMALITLVQSVHHITLESLPEGRQGFGRKLVDMLLLGWLKR
jgi:AcrR family transcriptional regulator